MARVRCGSGSLAATLFSVFATWALAKLNIRKCLTWFLQSCADNGGQALTDVTPFLPWNDAQERRR